MSINAEWVRDEIQALQADNAALRERLNLYNLGGWTDAERLMKERDDLRADAERYRALKHHLAVDRDEPHDWTCWVRLDCVPFRSKTDDPQVLVDMLTDLYAARATSSAPAKEQP